MTVPSCTTVGATSAHQPCTYVGATSQPVAAAEVRAYLHLYMCNIEPLNLAPSSVQHDLHPRWFNNENLHLLTNPVMHCVQDGRNTYRNFSTTTVDLPDHRGNNRGNNRPRAQKEGTAMSDLEIVMTIRGAVKGNVAVFYPCQCDEHETGQEHFIDQLTSALVAIQRQPGCCCGGCVL